MTPRVRSDAEADRSERLVAPAFRPIGCFFGILPVVLFAATRAIGPILGEGPLPDGSIGQAPGRGAKVLLALTVAAIGFVVGMRWISGRPGERGAALRTFLGIALLGATVLRSEILDSVTALLGTAGIGLLVSTLVSSDRFDPPEGWSPS